MVENFLFKEIKKDKEKSKDCACFAKYLTETNLSLNEALIYFEKSKAT